MKSFSMASFTALGLAGLLIAPLSPLSAQDEAEQVFSGPQAGEALPPLPVQPAWSDDDATVDWVAQAGEKPVALMFVHERTRPTLGLAMIVMKYCRQQESLASGICMLSADPTETQTWMGRIKNYFPAGSQVGVSLDGPEGPGAWGLNRNVSLTVVIAKDNRVVANFALGQPSAQTDGQKIIDSIAKTLGKPTPVDISEFIGRGRGDRMAAARPNPEFRQRWGQVLNPELSAEERAALLDKWEAELEKTPNQKAALAPMAKRILESGRLDSIEDERLKKTLTEWANQAPPARPAGPDAKLTGMLRSFIQKSNSDERVDELAKQIEAYIESDEAARRELARISRTVAGSDKLENYGTPHCQEILKRWSERLNPMKEDQ